MDLSSGVKECDRIRGGGCRACTNPEADGRVRGENSARTLLNEVFS